MGRFSPRRVGILVDHRHHAHDEARRAEGALEPGLVENRLLNRMQGSIGRGETLDRGHFGSRRLMGQRRAGVLRAAVDQHGAGAAFAAIAPQLGSREPELVPQGHGQGLLGQDVDAAVLAVHPQGDQPFGRSLRRLLGVDHSVLTEEVAGGIGRSAAGDDPLDESTSGDPTAGDWRRFHGGHLGHTLSAGATGIGRGCGRTHSFNQWFRVHTGSLKRMRHSYHGVPEPTRIACG